MREDRLWRDGSCARLDGGRPGEIEVVMALVLADWAEGRIPMVSAARSLKSYLDGLHASAQSELGLEPELDCCCDEAFLTELADGDAETRMVARAPSTPSRAPTEDTWFDPGVILLEVRAQDGDAIISRERRLAALLGQGPRKG